MAPPISQIALIDDVAVISITEGPTEKPTVERLAYIDGLRGLAILLVLLTHVWVYAGAPALAVHIGKLNLVLAALPAVGFVGVDLFLVLSGFCLAWSFLSSPEYARKTSVSKFWLRRVKRIVPAYYISIAVVLAMYPAFGWLLHQLPASLTAGRPTLLGTLPAPAEIEPHLFFVHNLSQAHISTINGSYWSLALEFQLYLAFPLLLTSARRWGAWRTLAVVLAVQIAYQLLLEHTFDSGVLLQSQCVLGKSLLGRIATFYMGILAAHILANGTTRERMLTARPGGWLSLTLLTTAFLSYYQNVSAGGLPAVCWAAGFALLLGHAASKDTFSHRVLSWKPLARLGVISYSVYLLHQPLIERFSYLITLHFRPGSAFFVGLACLFPIVGICVLYYRLVEAPFLNYFSGQKGGASARNPA